MTKQCRSPLYFAEQHLNLLSLLSTLRELDGESALIWVRLNGAGNDLDSQRLMNQLVSISRGALVAANAGYFVEQMSPCSLAAVLEFDGDSTAFAGVAELLRDRVLTALGPGYAEHLEIDLVLNQASTGPVGASVASLAQADDHCLSRPEALASFRQAA